MKFHINELVEKRMQSIAAEKERLIEAWIAATGLHPTESTLVQQEKDGVVKFWVESHTDRCMTHLSELEQLRTQLASVAYRGGKSSAAEKLRELLDQWEWDMQTVRQAISIIAHELEQEEAADE